MNATDLDQAFYLVGVAPSGGLSSFSGHGLEEGQVSEAIAIEGFDALVVRVPASMFSGPDAEKRTEDVTWLKPRAEKHEAILRDASERSTVMPVGFGGVFSSEHALQLALRAHAGDIHAYLEENADCDEWSLKASVVRQDALDRARTELSGLRTAEQTSEGADYLQRRKLDHDALIHVEDRVLELLDELIEHLGDTVLDYAERKIVETGEEDGRWMLANIALLIERDALEAFNTALDKHSDALDAFGVTLELSGPWPPYTFCPRLGDDETADEADAT